MLKKIGLLCAFSISVFAMHSAEININQKDLEFGLNIDMGQYNRGIEPDTTFVGVTYLKLIMITLLTQMETRRT